MHVHTAVGIGARAGCFEYARAPCGVQAQTL